MDFFYSFILGRSTSWRDDDAPLNENTSNSNTSGVGAGIQRSFSSISTDRGRPLLNDGGGGLALKNDMDLRHISSGNSIMNLHNGSRNVKKQQEQNLPEWAMENTLMGGTFDATGAFHGNNDERILGNDEEVRPHHQEEPDGELLQPHHDDNAKGDDGFFFKESETEKLIKIQHIDGNNIRIGEEIAVTASNNNNNNNNVDLMLKAVADDMIEKLIMDNNEQPQQQSTNAINNLVFTTLQQHQHKQQIDLVQQKEQQPITVVTNTQGSSSTINQQLSTSVSTAGSSDDLWYYRDPQLKIQGPFSAIEMCEWYRAGYFNEHLYVRRVSDQRFRTLGELIKLCHGQIPFTHTHLLSPIVMTTLQQEELQQQQQQHQRLLSIRQQQQHLQQQPSTMQQLQLQSAYLDSTDLKLNITAAADSLGAAVKNLNSLELTQMLNLHFQMLQKQYQRHHELLILSELSKNECFQQLLPNEKEAIVQQKVLNLGIPDYLTNLHGLSTSLATHNPTAGTELYHVLAECTKKIVPSNTPTPTQPFMHNDDFEMQQRQQSFNLMQQHEVALLPPPPTKLAIEAGAVDEQQQFLQMWSETTLQQPIQQMSPQNNPWTLMSPIIVGVNNIVNVADLEQQQKQQLMLNTLWQQQPTTTTLQQHFQQINNNNSNQSVDQHVGDTESFNSVLSSPPQQTSLLSSSTTTTITLTPKPATTTATTTTLSTIDEQLMTKQQPKQKQQQQSPPPSPPSAPLKPQRSSKEQHQQQSTHANIVKQQQAKQLKASGDKKQLQQLHLQHKDEQRRRQQKQLQQQQLLLQQEQKKGELEEKERLQLIQAQRRKALANSTSTQVTTTNARATKASVTSVAPWSAAATTISAGGCIGVIGGSVGTGNILPLAEIQKAERRERQRIEQQQRQLELLQQQQQQHQQNNVFGESNNGGGWNAQTIAVKSLAEIQAEEAKRLILYEQQRKQDMLEQQQQNYEQQQQQQQTNLFNINVWQHQPQLTTTSPFAQQQTQHHVTAASVLAAGLPTTLQQQKSLLKKSQTVSTMQNASSSSSSVPTALGNKTNKSTKVVKLLQQQSAAAATSTNRTKSETDINKNNINNKPSTSASNTHKHKSSNSNDLEAEFTVWCTRSLNNMQAKVDVPTFVSFLQDLESPFEIKDYIRMYLGESKEYMDFAKQFLERRSKCRSLQRAQNAHNDDMCKPAPAITPSAHDNSEKGKQKKAKKSKMMKLDARILGFSVTAAAGRINVGDRDYVDAP